MGKRGDGSIRERRPDVFEIRVAIGIDPRSGRTLQRSFYFHGSREDAEARRNELAAEFAEHRATRVASPFLTVGELMERWVEAPRDWRPATRVSASWMAKVLSDDPIAKRRVSLLRPSTMRSVMAEWREHGVTVASVSGRFRVLRAALTWASLEGIIDHNPLREMRGPERPGTRLHVPAEQIAALIRTSEVGVEKAEANLDRQGDLLGAQQRLGHRDASTTLRNYAHALPLEDEEAADQIEQALLGFGRVPDGPSDQPAT